MRKDFPNHKNFDTFKCYKCKKQLLKSKVFFNQCFCPICYTHYFKNEVIEADKLKKEFLE